MADPRKISALTERTAFAGNEFFNAAVPGVDNYKMYAPTSPPQGRLTLVTATPVMTASQSAKTTLYYTPAVGNIIPLYNGTRLVPYTFAELSVATTNTTKNPAAIGVSKVNDWFVWDDAGTLRLTHSVDWTNDTTRASGLTFVNGLYVNTASITNGPAASRGTYVGTTRSNGSSQLDYIIGGSASGGTAAFLGVWNAHNRVLAGASVVDSGTTYNYTTATIRQARASAGNQISFVVGLQEDAVHYSLLTESGLVAALNANAKIGVGINSTSAFSVGRSILLSNVAAALTGSIFQAGNTVPAIGVTVLSSNEQGDGTNANTFCNNSTNTLKAVIRN